VTAVIQAPEVRENVREETHEWGPLHPPRQASGLREVVRQRYLLWLLVRKERKLRYSSSFMGMFWSYVQPITRFCVYYFIAAGLLDRTGTVNRGLHIFSGMVIMQFFSTALSSGAKAVIKNKSLLRKVNIPREMFPVASIAVSVYNMFPLYVVMLIADFIYGWNPDLGALYAAVLGFVIIVVYGLGFAILLSAINVFVRDTSNVVDVINTLLRWTAPVIYTYSMIRPKLEVYPILLQLYINNPFNCAVMLNNRAFWITSFPPDPEHPNVNPITVGVIEELPAHMFERGLILLVAGFVFIAVAQLVFSRVEGKFADKL
jgi:ABC-2 type transport system permease protein